MPSPPYALRIAPTLEPLPATASGRLHHAARHATGAVLDINADLLNQPVRLARELAERLGFRVLVTGTLDRRLVFIEDAADDGWVAADLSGQPHASRLWPHWAGRELAIEHPDMWLSRAKITPAGLHRLTRPRLLLVALYHPEIFPLPRFPLGISDLARAARATLSGQVELIDMQLGADLTGIIRRIDQMQPDVVGVSATFGQHDLTLALLDRILTEGGPLVIAGGSLTARNERLLLRRYPSLLVARGAGEATIADIVAYWHGDLALDQIRGIGYRGKNQGDGVHSIGVARHTATMANRARDDIWPELDLLAATFDHKGVAQLETSRGCTNFCSFCPRGHKGTWAGVAPESLDWICDAFATVFDAYPHISRTLYLVDEEFIGRDPGAPGRALKVADMLHKQGFAWETSCRIDQVVRPDQDRCWHIARGHLWRQLVAKGLRRCLFGVESGVTSILERFNKETTGEQNALAIRTLSALGVPTRFTYITFDHLMTPEELHATSAFQGRTDLILRPLLDLDIEQIVDGVRDEEFVAGHATGQPFYEEISYMLVSMECLIGAAYTRAVQAAGLAGSPRPSMGRVDADFADWRIGVLSQRAQLWVDRNFALDYTLKSLEKLTDGERRRQTRDARRVLKRAAYLLLGEMLTAMDDTPPTASPRRLDEECRQLAETRIAELHDDLDLVITSLANSLPADDAATLTREHARWASTDSWYLINAVDPCGT